jgi:phosphoribosylformylglycinamidine cyclo-ligase
MARRVLLERYDLHDTPAGLQRALGDELLEPTAIYAPEVLRLTREGLVHAAAHITGGGFVENVPRALPEGLGAEIDRGSWTVPPVFELVQREAGASDDEMFETFNMGIGMVLVVPPESAERAAEGGSVIGRVVAGSGLDIR